jgi:hypothetical protein
VACRLASTRATGFEVGPWSGSKSPDGAFCTKGGVEFTNGDQPGNSEGEIVMRPWLPDPRVLNVLIRSGISVGPEDVRTHLPLWRLELRKQLQEKPTSDGKPMTRAEADSCIDKALASGALDSNGIFTFRVKGTREQIVEQILQVCELWNEPMTRAKAEAKADAAIRAIRRQRVFAWLSWAISVLAIILAMSLIIGTITAQADPCGDY